MENLTNNTEATKTMKKTARIDKLICVLNAAGEKGLTSKQLGTQLGISEASVPVYACHARQVLPENTRLLKTVRGTGSCKHRYYRLVQE